MPTITYSSAPELQESSISSRIPTSPIQESPIIPHLSTPSLQEPLKPILYISINNTIKKILKPDTRLTLKKLKLKLSYDSAFKLINNEYTLITTDYFFNRFKEILKYELLSDTELLLEIKGQTKQTYPFKLINEKVFIETIVYLEIFSKLFLINNSVAFSKSDNIINNITNNTNNINNNTENINNNTENVTNNINNNTNNHNNINNNTENITNNINNNTENITNNINNNTENINNINNNTKIKYFKKKISKSNSIFVEPLNSNNYLNVMRKKYLNQISEISSMALSFMLLFLIDVKSNDTVGVLDEIKGVLAFSIYETSKQNRNIIYYSTHSYEFSYLKELKFISFNSLISLVPNMDLKCETKDYNNNYNNINDNNYNNIDDNNNKKQLSYKSQKFSFFFIGTSQNKIDLINLIKTERFIIYISNLNELTELSLYLFKNTDKFTDILIKEFLGREIKVKEYGDVFIHPEIKGKLGKGWVISFVCY
ncbi:hypothetical protein CDIK_1763 [Cucumispora dikerogammari]|nr:hypothetical protein CDIK_1763 [Cucumispora dikerogammari]